MSNNIYDILKKIESLEAPKKTNLTESKMTTVKELHNESKKEKQTNKGTIAEAVAQVEKQLSEKFQGFKKSSAPEIGSNLPKSDTETFGLEPGRGYDIKTPKDWKPGDKRRDVRELIPTQDKKDHIRSRLGKHVKPAHLPEGTVEESGLMYHAGVEKHGQKYMDLAKKAGQKGASQEELGRLKDKHSKAYKNKKMDEGDDSYTQDMRDKDLAGLDRIFKKPAPNKELKYNGFVIRAEGSDLGVYYQGKDTGYNFQKLDQAKAFIDQYGGKFVDGELNEDSYNEEMLSPKQKKIASMAGDPDKIDAKDFAALRGEKKGTKNEGPEILKIKADQAKAQGKDSFEVGDKTFPVKEGRKSMREGWEEMQKYLDKKRGPESKGGEGKKAGTRYGGSAQKDDDDEETDGEGKPVEKKKGRPKGTGGGAKFSFKKPKD